MLCYCWKLKPWSFYFYSVLQPLCYQKIPASAAISAMTVPIATWFLNCVIPGSLGVWPSVQIAHEWTGIVIRKQGLIKDVPFPIWPTIRVPTATTFTGVTWRNRMLWSVDPVTGRPVARARSNGSVDRRSLLRVPCATSYICIPMAFISDVSMSCPTLSRTCSPKIHLRSHTVTVTPTTATGMPKSSGQIGSTWWIRTGSAKFVSKTAPTVGSNNVAWTMCSVAFVFVVAIKSTPSACLILRSWNSRASWKIPKISCAPPTIVMQMTLWNRIAVVMGILRIMWPDPTMDALRFEVSTSFWCLVLSFTIADHLLSAQ